METFRIIMDRRTGARYFILFFPISIVPGRSSEVPVNSPNTIKWLPCREILPLSGKIFFITAESAEIAEKEFYNEKQKISLRSSRALR